MCLCQSSAEVQDRRRSWLSEDKDNSDCLCVRRHVNFITLSTFNWGHNVSSTLTSVLCCNHRLDSGCEPWCFSYNLKSSMAVKSATTSQDFSFVAFTGEVFTRLCWSVSSSDLLVCPRLLLRGGSVSQWTQLDVLIFWWSDYFDKPDPFSVKSSRIL